MKIEVIEPGGFFWQGERFGQGDIREVADAMGAQACGLGWAKDAAGKIPTGQRDLKPRILDPKPIIHT